MLDKKEGGLTFVAVGDVSPNRDDPPSIFRNCGETFRKADVVFGQMEAPLSDRGTPMFIPGLPCRLMSKNISALNDQGAGFDVMSFASNHAMDYGCDAFYDTLDALRKNNIAVVGAGHNVAEARKPMVIGRNGTEIGFLAYLSIVFPGVIAQENTPGCVPLRSSHFYQPLDFQPGIPPIIITKLWERDRAAMEDDIRRLRPQVDVLVVSMHCGVHHVPAMVAMYQKEAAYAAIDIGADLVLQHHAHILKGIEVHKGSAIFYGLGNFALEHSLPFPGQPKPFDSEFRAEKRRIFGIRREPGYEKHDFHHDALKTLIAKAYIQDKKIQQVTYIPCYINPDLEPEVLARTDPRAQEVFDYVRQISEAEGLNAHFSWEGDEVLIG